MLPQPERHRLGDDTPALVWRAAGPSPTPALVWVPGGGNSKESVTPETVGSVLSSGVTLVAIDMYLHGEHLDTAASSFRGGYDTLLEIVSHTAHELEAVVADLAADPAIDDRAVGVRGASLGAYVALTALGLGVPFCAGLSLAGAAGFEATLAHDLRASGASERKIEREQRRLRAGIGEFDPLYRVATIAPRPLMMIHGLNDEAVPIAAHRALYDALAPHYATAPGDCVFVTHPGGHEVPAAMHELGWDWLRRRLTASDD